MGVSSVDDFVKSLDIKGKRVESVSVRNRKVNFGRFIFFGVTFFFF